MNQFEISLVIWICTAVCVIYLFYGAMQCRWVRRHAEMLSFFDSLTDRRCFDGRPEPAPVVEVVEPRTPFVK